MGIREIAEQIRKRSLSPVELTTDCLARIERLNPKLNAFITVTADPRWRRPARPKSRFGVATGAARCTASRSRLRI